MPKVYPSLEHYLKRLYIVYPKKEKGRKCTYNRRYTL